MKLRNYYSQPMLFFFVSLMEQGCVPPYVPFLHIYPCGVGHDLRGDVPATQIFECTTPHLVYGKEHPKVSYLMGDMPTPYNIDNSHKCTNHAFSNIQRPTLH